MARIIIVSASDTNRKQLTNLLASSGFQAFRCCGSGSELRRALSESEDCVVIQAGRVPGCKPDDLIWDYGERIQLLLIASPTMFAECESDSIFRLALPVSGQAVIGAVQMLSQLHGMKLPKRTQDDRQTIDQAKRLIMKTQGLTEPEAHREMQRYAMNHGMKMIDCATRILQEAGKAEERE